MKKIKRIKMKIKRNLTRAHMWYGDTWKCQEQSIVSAKKFKETNKELDRTEL